MALNSFARNVYRNWFWLDETQFVRKHKHSTSALHSGESEMVAGLCVLLCCSINNHLLSKLTCVHTLSDNHQQCNNTYMVLRHLLSKNTARFAGLSRLFKKVVASCGDQRYCDPKLPQRPKGAVWLWKADHISRWLHFEIALRDLDRLRPPNIKQLDYWWRRTLLPDNNCASVSCWAQHEIYELNVWGCKRDCKALIVWVR